MNLQLSARILVHFRNVFYVPDSLQLSEPNARFGTHNITYLSRWVADEQFAALFNELQARQKLMQLFGH